MSSFFIPEIKSGILFDQTLTMYPSVMRGFKNEEREFGTSVSTTYGFVISGKLSLRVAGFGSCEFGAGAYFSCPGSMQLAGEGEAILVERIGFRGLFQVGGALEDSGRLCYIDNASTSILVHPPRKGDPVLNYLCFPQNIEQSFHIHPSIRMGVVYAGSGVCSFGNGESFPLRPGTAFYLPERWSHRFCSHAEGLKVIAYHPDSDVGSTDQVHPMLSRTYLE